MLSADGVRDTFEYSRYPANWNDYEKAFRRLCRTWL